MSLLTRKTLVALKKEASYGVAETLAGSNCFQATVDPSRLTPLAGNAVARDFNRPYLGNSSTLQVEAYRQLAFDVEAAGSSAAGTPPPYGDALLACGLAATIVASTSVAYNPISAAFSSASIECFIDTIKHQLLGSRGNVSLNLAKGAIPKWAFTFIGSYVAPADATPLTPDFSAFQVPQAPNSTYTPTVTLFGESLCMESFNIDLGNTTVNRDLPGCTPRIELTNRAPKGTLVVELTPVAAYAWIEAARTKTSGALEIAHGIGAGKVLTITAPNVTLDPPSFSDSDGIVMLSLPLVFEPDAGNDEVLFTFT